MTSRSEPLPPSPPVAEDDGELLITGQEEVFSRTEVELGRIEHSPGRDAKVDGGRNDPTGQLQDGDASDA
jgi:hypothetical protein